MVIASMLQKLARYSPSSLPIRRSRPAAREDTGEAGDDTWETQMTRDNTWKRTISKEGNHMNTDHLVGWNDATA